MTEPLLEQAEDFAQRLTDLFRQTVDPSVTFEIVGSGERIRIGPGPFDANSDGFKRVALHRYEEETDAPDRVSLKVEFTVAMGDSIHLTVEKSAFGLWVRPDQTRGARPIVRIEYDRDARSKPAAHVHFHAESAELGWLYGTAGKTLPRMDEMHFPVGGRRFRPTIEELLLFLDREQLFNDWISTNWKAVVEASLAEWERRQVHATVARNPEIAADQLRSMGYEVKSSSPE